ncbi:hypothetical protein PoB_003547900 [Plakobranchus ocellatus]|uniref:Uncharacterized protein n=1 Tax=Plakobranchus ocellatus TaxID=259542 RepID=A0AAV4AMH2_9GAST|nr:hypothetical protein PoB_003547900 [Plakobranchus ocellatus]
MSIIIINICNADDDDDDDDDDGDDDDEDDGDDIIDLISKLMLKILLPCSHMNIFLPMSSSQRMDCLPVDEADCSRFRGTAEHLGFLAQSFVSREGLAQLATKQTFRQSTE